MVENGFKPVFQIDIQMQTLQTEIALCYSTLQ